MLRKEEVFAIWAPFGARWSDWAKPVSFAFIDGVPPDMARVEAPDCPSWIPSPARETALVLDLPGDEGVRLGLAVARVGYRPVPLYNALPFPTGSSVGVPRQFIHELYNIVPLPTVSATLGQSYLAAGEFPGALVNVAAIVKALWKGAEDLVTLSIADDAPPAFLLDANRRGGAVSPEPGRFDNRSLCFTTDFPSAIRLRTGGISKVLLVRRSAVLDDLTHTLRRWQDGGLTMESKDLDVEDGPAPCLVPTPARFSWVWFRVLTAMGLRRNVLGGFGGIVPEPGSGG